MPTSSLYFALVTADWRGSLIALLLGTTIGQSGVSPAQAALLDNSTGRLLQSHPQQNAQPGSTPAAQRSIYLPLVQNSTSSSDNLSSRGLSTPQLIEQAFGRGDITNAERALYLAYALYEPKSLPLQFQSQVGWYGTRYVREVQPYLQNISAAASSAVQQELNRLSPLAATICDKQDGANPLIPPSI